jgi:hypothetical protein
MTINVEENIKKARRSAYGLFGGGYHGNNGLDPDTLIHLLRIWICASTGSNPESMYTAGSAVLVDRESICFIIRF